MASQYKKAFILDTTDIEDVRCDLDTKPPINDGEQHVYGWHTFGLQKMKRTSRVVYKLLDHWGLSEVYDRDNYITTAHILEYDVGGYAESHFDGSDHTIVTKLHDDSIGGDLYVDGEHVPFEEGESITYSGDTPHYVTELKSGSRQVLIVWLTTKKELESHNRYPQNIVPKEDL